MKAILLLLSMAGASAALEIRCSGVLGNSGEQGSSLVRFAEKTATGMGVAWDAAGTIWDRGGDGRLNRYAVDGRLLASYPLPPGGGPQDKDTLLICGDSLLLKLGKKLYRLSLDAPAGAEPVELGIDAKRLSLSAEDGWAAAANGKAIFLVNSSGETKPVATSEEDISDLEIGPRHGIYAKSGDKIRRVDRFAPEKGAGPWTAPDDRPQWIADRWFGSAWHGTLRRFGEDFLPDPGVVLGGASGSFIGYVEGNHELNDSRGLATTDGRLFAASGAEGVMHLMEWRAAENRFALLRRIGAMATCSALVIDADRRVYFNGGFWDWSDAPDTPLRHSVPPPQAPGFAGASAAPDGGFVGPAIRWDKPAIYYGGHGGPLKLSEDIPLPEGAVASTLLRVKDRDALFISDSRGKGRICFVSREGRFEGDGGAAELRTREPIGKLTSLTPSGPELLAAADGKLLRLNAVDGGWQEKQGIEAGFGAEIYLAASGDLLWVSDTENHRVLCLRAGKPIAEFGTAGRKGADLQTLDQPRAIGASGTSAAVFDSGNQRLMKLELR
ncbi:hypothetical protein [Luteolibacter luteus]|uniref:Uncharacterized protein n=1 Tax=Luteolibacter luteus TaxID=2728835 RepID=A0A858REH3_9BACT|nr:hypothetical protein [Luteolibacter luteus]QJE94948.1 hypothetical protein HHL09_03860 [Luteolibacter luteus]